MLKVLVIYFVLMGLPLMAQGKELTLVKSGKSAYAIVVVADAPSSELHAARELQHFIAEMSGALMPILTDAYPLPEKAVVLGENRWSRSLVPDLNVKELGKEGYIQKTVGEHLVIAGGKPRGTLFGVYGLLEDHLGCRWFTPDCSRIPKSRTIQIPELDESVIPRLEYRDPFFSDAFDGDWVLRNRMNSSRAAGVDSKGGKVRFSDFAWCHTFHALVPPSKYFEEHPEYYSEINGKRQAAWAQLCLTNPDVLRIAIEQVKEWIRNDPKADIFSVSQNDWGGNCQCASCRALDEAEGSPAGSLITFVNAVADEIAEEFPSVLIETLAYQYSRKPPKTVRPRPNVVVRLCSIECCFGHPLAEDDYPHNVSFRDDIIGWGKLMDRLYVWDYVTNFAHYLMPFLNLRVLKPNIQFFADHGVKGIFEQGNYSAGGHGEMAPLRSYLMAKFLWNPDYDYETALTEFLEGYYGKAAAEIREYIDLMHERLAETGNHLTIYHPPTESHLDTDTLEQAERILIKAEGKVRHNPVLLQRVRMVQTGIQYVQLATGRTVSPVVYEVRDGKYRPLEKGPAQGIPEKFTSTVLSAGVTEIREGASIHGFLDSISRLPRGEFDVFEKQTSGIELQVLGGLGGRVLTMKDRITGRNLLASADPQFRNYPADGGYWEAYDSAGTVGTTEDYEVTENDSGLSLSVSLAGDLSVKRLYVAQEKGFRVVTTLSNSGSSRSYPTILRAITQWDLKDAKQWVLLLPGAGTPLRLNVSNLVSSDDPTREFPTAQFGSSWILWNAASSIGIVGESDSAVKTLVFELDKKRSVLKVNQRTGFHAIRKGAEWATERSYRIIHSVPEGLGSKVESTEWKPESVVVIEPDSFRLFRQGELSRIVADRSAEGGVCGWLTGHTREWAIQAEVPFGRLDPEKRYELVAHVKAVKKSDAGSAYTVGIWDRDANRAVLSVLRDAAKVSGDWEEFSVGTFAPGKSFYIWICPEANPDAISEVRVSRFVIRQVVPR